MIPSTPVCARRPTSETSRSQAPRYFCDSDAFVRERIERQGLTAGVFGDPPPGRSALDARRCADGTAFVGDRGGRTGAGL